MPMIPVRAPAGTRPDLPEDGPLMALCRVDDPLRLMLGGKGEDSDQGRLATRLDRQGLPWFHAHNEGKRDHAARGAALRRGLKRGVPDILIFRPFVWGGVHYVGLAVELKRPDATACKVKDDQRLWLARLRSCGWMAEWARGYIEADRLITRAYATQGHTPCDAHSPSPCC